MKNGQGMVRHTMRVAETLIMLACCVTHLNFEAKAAPVPSEIGVVRYLSQFGYLPPIESRNQEITSEEALSKAISEYQSFVGLDVTGNMDTETAHQMTLPRCGVKDKVEPSAGDRSKRWALFHTTWPVKSLTYKISNYPRSLDKTSVDTEIARALAVWSNYTDLTFTRMSGEVDIEIRFELGDHSDGSPFDGPPSSLKRGNLLAHGFNPGPNLGGDVHFDDSELWTANSYDGTNLFQVAAHEIGHALGLDHSHDMSAVMAPIYRSYMPNFMLGEDDITGIQALYGTKTIRSKTTQPRITRPETWGFEITRPKMMGFETTGSETTETKATDERPDICADPRIDTMFNTNEGNVYIFKGIHYWRLTTNGIAAGYPKLISEGWEGLPSNIDAAFTHKGRTYFFKGSEYWAYVGGRMDGRYPRKIRANFPGIPNNIDAATVWSRDGQIYFYKGSESWKFNPTKRRPVKVPYSISSWRGLPANIVAAHSYDGNTYFFKGDAYYRFDDGTFSTNPASPYETGPNLFGCRSQSNGISRG